MAVRPRPIRRATTRLVLLIGVVCLLLGLLQASLGLVGFARMIPLLVFSFPAGAMADRVDRRRMLMLTQWGSAMTAVPLALATWLGLASIPLIVILALLAGLFDAFAWPVWSVFIKDLVGPEKLRTAVAVNSTRFNLTRIIGPSVGGILLAAWGATLCFAVAAVALVLSGRAATSVGSLRGWRRSRAA